MALDTFEALSHQTRLDVFRTLVRAGPDGLSAGGIAAELGVLQNTMSNHLQKLQRAAIVSSERHGRRVVYKVNFDRVRELILFLMEDCCGRSEELCEPIAQSLSC